MQLSHFPKYIISKEKVLSYQACCSGMLARGISPTYKVPWALNMHWEHETGIASAFPGCLGDSAPQCPGKEKTPGPKGVLKYLPKEGKVSLDQEHPPPQ